MANLLNLSKKQLVELIVDERSKYATSPVTGRKLIEGGRTHKKLIKQGHVKLPKNERLIINPLTGRKLTEGGVTHKKLIKQGHLRPQIESFEDLQRFINDHTSGLDKLEKKIALDECSLMLKEEERRLGPTTQTSKKTLKFSKSSISHHTDF